MMRRALLLCLVLLAGCGSSSPQATVSIVDAPGVPGFVFRPATLHVHIGATVVWRNTTRSDHAVTALGASPAFDSGAQNPIAPGHSWSFTFHQPGTYRYTDVLSGQTFGTITVSK